MRTKSIQGTVQCGVHETLCQRVYVLRIYVHYYVPDSPNPLEKVPFTPEAYAQHALPSTGRAGMRGPSLVDAARDVVDVVLSFGFVGVRCESAGLLST